MASNGVKDTIAASNGSTLAEFNDTDYFDQVLSFQGGPNTEEDIDRILAEEAAILGVEVAPPITSYESLYDSTGTVQSRHARTGSSASQASVSTNATSRSSTEDAKSQNTSFDEYDQFIQQLDLYPPLPSQHTGQAPSLFSVSTKKSYSSIKDGIKNRFRMRRNKASNTQSKSVLYTSVWVHMSLTVLALVSAAGQNFNLMTLYTHCRVTTNIARNACASSSNKRPPTKTSFRPSVAHEEYLVRH